MGFSPCHRSVSTVNRAANQALGYAWWNAGTDAASPDARTLIGGMSRRPRRDIACNQVAVKMAWPLLLANDDRPQPTPNMGVELVRYWLVWKQLD